jgi:hypothetical protein
MKEDDRYLMPTRNDPHSGFFYKRDNRTSGDKKREKLNRRKRREKYSQEQRDGYHSGGYYHRMSLQREREFKEWEVREKRVNRAVNLTIILLSVAALAAIWFWGNQ